MRPVRWVLAVPESSPIQSVRDLQGKRIATEVVNLTRRYLEKHGVQAEVEFSWGATEIKAHQFVDAIVEVTETGNSLRANRLRIVETLLESSTRLIANRDAWKDPAKREKIENIALLLEAAIRAQGKVGVKMNVPKAAQREIMDLLPAITSPTVSQLADDGLDRRGSDPGRIRDQAPDSRAETRRRHRHHRIPAQQGRRLIRAPPFWRPLPVDILGVIPARYASSRFPGKLLAPLLGRPLILHTIESARTARRLTALVVATDDERIAAAVRAAGVEVCMTSPDCASGSDRAAEVIREPLRGHRRQYPGRRAPHRGRRDRPGHRRTDRVPRLRRGYRRRRHPRRARLPFAPCG
jgi:hypothetical protein